MEDLGIIFGLLGGVLGGLVVALVILVRLEDDLGRDQTPSEPVTPVRTWPQDPHPRAQ